MLQRPVTSEELARLRQERDEASRRYNDALTDVDRALPRLGGAPPAPAGFDEAQLAPLNQRWQILPGQALPPPRGLRSRLAHFVWNLVAPALERQQAFNSTLVDHLNRNVAAARAPEAAFAATADLLRAQGEALSAFQSHLIVYLQQITAYVDTKDRLVAGSLMAVYDAALDGLTTELLARWESMAAREARLDGKVGGVAAAHADLAASLATVQQRTLTIRRELERLLAGDGAAAASAPPPAGSLDSYKYVGFEDRFRGPQSEIRSRLASYVPLFAGATDVLDVGCGRGELLDLLHEASVPARGLELNHEMAETCRARGLDVAEGDWLSHLESLPDGSLGGLIAIQVVEHLEPAYLMRALDVAYHKLRPGAPIVLETINPASWFAFFSSYIRDLTHVRPLHPDTLTYLLTASGFMEVRADYRSPYPDAEKLQRVAVFEPEAPLADLADTVNGNTERLNALLFAHLDYAAIGVRR